MAQHKFQLPCTPKAFTAWSPLVAFLIYLSLALEGLTFWRTPIYDPDLGFHLLGGAWVDKYHDVPRADFINILNATWVDYHWLGQWMIHLVAKMGGFPAVQAMCGILGALLGVIIVAVVRTTSPGLKPLPTLLLASLSLAALMNNISTRPTSIAVVLVACGFLAVLKWNRRAFWILLPLTVICANIHIYWTLFPGLWVAAFGLPRFFPKNTARRYRVSGATAWGGAFALLGAGLVSPYGIFNPEPGLSAKLINFSVFIDVAINPAVLKQYVMELQSGLNFRGGMFWFSLFAALFVTRHLNLRRLGARSFETTLFFGTFVMFIEAIKYGVFFVVSAAAVMAPLLRRLLLRSKVATKLLNRCSPILPIVPVIFFALAWSTSPFREVNAAAAIKDLRYFQPIDACTAIRKIFPSPQKFVRVGSSYSYGGWCAWALNAEEMPSRYRLLMDGRTQFVPVSAIVAGFNLYALQGEWEKTLTELAPDVILVAREQPLGQMLYKLKDNWELRYSDEHFGLFIPKR